tara:strand:+ start:241068 stop:241676 length:609 start_codon:yes stop_codon:yes gene_type:complete
MAFNYRQFKMAQQRGQYPSHSLPATDRERWLRQKEDPYAPHKPGDGKGPKLTTPGSEGMMGQPPDPGFQAGGKERKGYPTGISQFEDPADSEKFRVVPSDSDPDDPFSGKSRGEGKGEYGKGQGTDYGQALHDDRNVHTDGYENHTLGIEETVKRDLDDDRRDRPPAITTMPAPPENPFNRRLKRNGPMSYVRERLRAASRR